MNTLLTNQGNTGEGEHCSDLFLFFLTSNIKKSLGESEQVGMAGLSEK